MTKVTVKCVGCGAKRIITENDKIDELGPFCKICGSPMVVLKVETDGKPMKRARAR